MTPLRKYRPTDEMWERISKTFTYHPPKDNQTERYEEIRSEATEFAILLMQLCPQSRELSLAMTALEECVMRANSAIAINE